MKKIAFLGLGLLAIASATAQNNLVKEVERTLKSDNVDYAAARAAIAPALENEETKGNAYAWYVAGKLEFDQYDNLFLLKSMGRDADSKVMGNALIDGYNLFMTALPLDSVPNEKGKIKPKYSKEIIKTITNHHDDFNRAASFLWEAKDYEGAYSAWGIFLDMPNHPVLAKNIVAHHDTIIGQTAYYQALSAWQAERPDSALRAFDFAINKGYKTKELYDYAISVAVLYNKTDKLESLAAEAHNLYGANDKQYISRLIMCYLTAENYDKALVAIDEALATDPNNGELYDVKGVIYDSQGKKDEAMEFHKKAIELNPEFARAHYNYGRKLCEKAYALSDSSMNLSQNEYNKVRDEQIFPLFKEAAEHLEKAYQLDENQSDALRYLRNVYYNLGDEENLKRIEMLQL